MSKVKVARPWDEAEAVRGWGDARDRDDFLSAVDLGSDLGVDKEGDHQILCMYESFVAEWKSNNPGKKMSGKVTDDLHTLGPSNNEALGVSWRPRPSGHQGQKALWSGN